MQSQSLFSGQNKTNMLKCHLLKFYFVKLLIKSSGGGVGVGSSFSLKLVKKYSDKHAMMSIKLTLLLLIPDIPSLCKQCRARSVGFWRTQLICVCTVCHKECEFISTIRIKQSDWLKIESGHGILIYSAGQGLTSSICSTNKKWNCKQTIILYSVFKLLT